MWKSIKVQYRVDKKEEVQRKVEKEELMNKVDRGERVTQLRDKTFSLLAYRLLLLFWLSQFNVKGEARGFPAR